MSDKQNVNEYNEEMMRVMGYEWLYHILTNVSMEYFWNKEKQSVPDYIQDKLRGADNVVLLAAGPSCEDFCSVGDNWLGVVIAGPTSAGVAFKAGHPPDVMLVVDSSIKHLKHLQNLYGNRKTDTLFYCCATVHPEVIKYLTGLSPNVVLYFPKVSRDNRNSKIIDDYNRILKLVGKEYNYMINAQCTGAAEMLFLKVMKMENKIIYLYGYDFATIDGVERCGHYVVGDDGEVVSIEPDSKPMEARKGEILTNESLMKHWESTVIVIEVLKKTLEGNVFVVKSRGIPLQPAKDGFEVLTKYYENGIIPTDDN